MANVLVTGGTGTLGRPTVVRLMAAGHQVTVVSRTSGAGSARPRDTGVAHASGDLLSGRGLRQAMQRVSVVVHLATGRRDDDATATVVREAETAAVAHLVMTSIVGIDQIPMPYYRRKLESERLVACSQVPHTIVRSTQFHDLVDRLFRAQRLLPFLLAPPFALQPIDVDEVAQRLTELVTAPPRGRADDIGGPETLPGTTLAEQWVRTIGKRRSVVPLPLPGRTVAAYRAGHQPVPGKPFGRCTFEQFLTARCARGLA